MHARHHERDALVQLARVPRQPIESKPDLVPADALQRRIPRDAEDERGDCDDARDLRDARHTRKAARFRTPR
jgi:hypothetical protein